MNRTWIKIIDCILLLLSMLMIFLFSQENGVKSEDKSKDVAREVISVIKKDSEDNSASIDTFVDNHLVIIRKSAHIIEYMVLGLCLLNFIKDYKNVNIKTIMLALILALIYAGLDEAHQLLITGRSASAVDVLFDTFGASLGIIIYYISYIIIKKKKSAV